MRIKEAEERTGLTAKAIRLYESKGLLNVARQTENDYRDYSEEDVARLKTIAILRKLDVPVKTIKEWTDGKTTLHAILSRAAEENREASQESELRHKLAEDLADLVDQDPERDLGEAVQELEELNALLDRLDKLIHEEDGHIASPLHSTILALAAIFWTVMLILDGGTPDRTLWTMAGSIVLTVLATLDWRNYLNTPKKERRSNGCLAFIIGIAVVLFSFFAFVIWISNWQMDHYTTAPSDILLQRGSWLMFIPVVELAIAMAYLYAKVRGEEWVLFEKLPKGRRAWAVLAVLLVIFNLFLLRGFMTNASVATEEGIMRYSIFDPDGTFHPYTDVERVETGFRGKLLGIPVEWTGDFYYKITYSDGITENWGDCGTQAEEETWTWMYRLDEWCLAGGAEKTGSTKHSEYCEMEQLYVDILVDVVNNR